MKKNFEPSTTTQLSALLARLAPEAGIYPIAKVAEILVKAEKIMRDVNTRECNGWMNYASAYTQRNATNEERAKIEKNFERLNSIRYDKTRAMIVKAFAELNLVNVSLRTQGDPRGSALRLVYGDNQEFCI